jgi:hypothetical protein
MMTGATIVGSAEVGLIVCTPWPRMSKPIVLGVVSAPLTRACCWEVKDEIDRVPFETSIASLNVSALGELVSAVVLTVMTARSDRSSRGSI